MKLTKRILASVLATACTVSSFSLASLAADPAENEMQLGLNATFYQTKGRDQGDRILSDKVSQATGWGLNDHNHGNDEGAAIEDDDKRFNESMAALEQITTEVKSDLTNIDSIGALADANALGVGDDSYWAHLTGDISLEAGTYQFGGKFDNGVVIEFTDKNNAEAEPIRALEFWGNGSWADAGSFGVLDNAVEIPEGDYKIDVYFLEYWGGNLASVKVKKDDGDFVAFDDDYEIDNPSTDVYTIYGFIGDWDQIADLIPTEGGGGAQTNYDENKRQYDETIEDIMGVLHEVDSVVLPSPTVENFGPDANAAGCNGNNAILVDYDGYITATETGTYQFGLKKVDNNVVVTVDDTRVVEYWTKAAWVDADDTVPFYDTLATVDLVAGEPVPFCAKYLELDGGDKLQIFARKVIAPEEEGGEVTYGDGALIDENFIFTQTADIDFDAAKALTLNPKLSSDVAEGDKVIFSGFNNLPEGSENNGVVVDAETGIATFNNRDTNIYLPESITKKINTSSKLVVEAIFKAQNSPGHGYVASVGTSTNESDDIRTAIMGLREGWAVKTIGSNDACRKNALRYKRWANVKWEFDATGSKVYVDGELVISNDKVVKLDKIEGKFAINHATNDWNDDGIVGQMSDFRITIDDYNPAEITELKVKDIAATLGDNDTYTVDVPLAEGETLTTENIAIATLGSEATGDTVAVTVVENTEDGSDILYTYNITVTANDDETLTKNYTLVVDAHIPSADATITGLKVNGIEAVKGENDKYTASVYKATRYDVTVDTTSDVATFGETTDVTAEGAAEGTKTLKVTVTAEDGTTTADYTVDITTDKELGDENGVIATMAPNGDGTWDGGIEKELNEDGDLILNAGNAGNFWGGYWRDVRPTNAILPQGVYKVVYLFDLAENSGNTMRIVPFMRWDGSDPDIRPNEVFDINDWRANAAGKKIAIAIVFQTKAEADDFEVQAWKGGDIAGTFDGVKICAADCDLGTALDGYEVYYEGGPKYYSNATEAAPEGSFVHSTKPADKSTNTGITSVKVNGVAATLSGTTYTAEVAKANDYSVVVTLADDKATYVYDKATKTITVTAEAGNTATYTVVIKEKEEDKKDDKPAVVAVSKVALNKTKATLAAGKTVTLRATVTPSNATDKKVVWTTSNSKVATVNAAGKVTAKGVGTAKITAKAGGKSATCTITVKPGAVKNLKAKAKGKTLTITFKKGAKSASTKIVVLRGKKVVKTKTIKNTKLILKKLKAGKYTVKATAIKKVGKKTYTSSVVKTKKATKIK